MRNWQGPGTPRRCSACPGAETGNQAQLCLHVPRTRLWVCLPMQQASEEAKRCLRRGLTDRARCRKKVALLWLFLVAYAAACRPWVLNCIEPQRTRCASPKRMLLCVHARIAPKMSLVVSGVSLQQTQRSHARSKDKGRGTASRLSYASTCFAYEVTKLFCVQS